jgi:hypothetical protein
MATPDNSAESRMEAGNEIGDLAMQLFGDFVEVSAHKDNGKMDLSEMIARTNELLREECPVICEASFSYNGNYCAVDILKRENGGYAIYEVKSSTHANQIYATDIAYQKYVLENCGIKINKVFVVLLSENYIRGKTFELDKYFVLCDVTQHTTSMQAMVKDKLAEIGAMLNCTNEPSTKFTKN